MKKYKILTTVWHIYHYYDLFNALKEDAEFYVLFNSHRQWQDPRFYTTRPIPENAIFVPYYEKGKYDLVILNVDQQLVNPDFGKTQVMKEIYDNIKQDKDVPIVFINHASPVYPEYLQKNGVSEEEAQRLCINKIREFIGDCPMITNSYTAASEKEWGWGYPIWHGMEAKEWLDLPKEPRVFTALSPGGCDKYYNRECMNEAGDIMLKLYGYHLTYAKVNKEFKSVKDYKEFLGSSLIYLDTSFRTPMNRARTEAMLSGCCVVQVEGAHDLDRIYNGKNMVIVPNNPQKIANIINDLIENRYKEAVKIGQEGKKTAIELFNRERYRADWLKFIKTILCK